MRHLNLNPSLTKVMVFGSRLVPLIQIISLTYKLTQIISHRFFPSRPIVIMSHSKLISKEILLFHCRTLISRHGHQTKMTTLDRRRLP
jgi:hypothetical protein